MVCDDPLNLNVIILILLFCQFNIVFFFFFNLISECLDAIKGKYLDC